MSKPVGIATGAVLVSGIAVANGWPHAIAAMALVVLATRLAYVGKRARDIRETLAWELRRSWARRTAEYIVTFAAARSNSHAARDLALEAISSLDELADDGASTRKLIAQAAQFALGLRTQERVRARSQALNPRARTRPRTSGKVFFGRRSETTWHRAKATVVMVFGGSLGWFVLEVFSELPRRTAVAALFIAFGLVLAALTTFIGLAFAISRSARRSRRDRP